MDLDRLVGLAQLTIFSDQGQLVVIAHVCKGILRGGGGIF